MCPELPRIRTSRLLLAALQPEQASALSRLADEFVIATMTAALPSPYTREHAQAFIAEIPGHFAAGRTLSLGVHIKETSELTGSFRYASRHRITAPIWGTGPVLITETRDTPVKRCTGC